MKIDATLRVTPIYSEDSFDEVQELSQVSDEIKRAAVQLGEGYSADSSETMVFARQLETIKSRVYEKKYAELKGRSLVPVSYEGGGNSEYITFRVWDQFAIAKVVADYATDFPLVTTSAVEYTAKYFDIGNAYQVSMRDLERAAKAGVDITSKYGMMARRGIELGIDDIVAKGVPQIKTYGLVNNPNVSLLSLPNGNWGSATGQQMLDDLNYLVTNTQVSTLDIWKIDHIVMTIAAFRKISTTLLNSANASNITVLQAFQTQNPGITVETWTRLNGANADGVNGRLVAYKKDPEVLEFEMGQDFRIYPPEQRGLTLTYACLATAAGVLIHHPAGVTYCDNQVL